MNKLVSVGFVASVLALSATAAFAQSTSTPSTQSTQTPQTTGHLKASYPGGMGLESSIWNNALTNQATLRAQFPKARVERAERAAALINTNRCADAYKLALDEKDQDLANNILKVCTAHD